MVVDDSLLPVGDAVVTLVEAARETRTTLAGHFAFSKVTPGEHTLDVQAQGHKGKPMRFTVFAGEVAQLQITMTATAAPTPRSSTTQVDGFWSCWVPFVINPICDGVDLVNNNFRGDIRVESNFSALALEVTWVRNSGVTSASDAQVQLKTNATQFQYESPPPVRIVVEAEKPAFNGKVVETDVDQVHWQAIPGRGADAITQGNVLTHQQRFKVYLTVFHNMAPEEGFSAIPDG